MFDPASRAMGWPAPPDQTRVRLVGQLTSDRDLKPGRTFGRRMGDALFGREPERALISPVGIGVDARQRILVCDSGARAVHVFDLERRTYERWEPDGEDGDGFVLPIAVAAGADGVVLVSDSGAGVIHRFGSDGTHTATLGEGVLERPCGLVIDDTTGDIYVADPGAHQVVRLSSEGVVLQRIGRRGSTEGEFNFPTYVARDESGHLYVSDSLNFRVQVFDADMRFVRSIGSKGDLPGYFAQPKGLAFDPDGHLYVVDSHFEAVQLFDRGGRLLMTFGEEGRGEGQFWLPVGIHIDTRGWIWIADSYNRRVQVFEYVREVES
jgi:DNA-binding beta-propeller fold protein YncE